MGKLRAKLGILAGGGKLPGLVIQACRQSSRPFFIIAFEDHTPRETVAGHPHAWVRLGAAGKAIKALREAGAEELVMAGTIRRPTLGALRPDAWAAMFLARTGAMSLGDDGLLRSLIRELERKEGLRVIGVDALLPQLLAPMGVYGALRPDERAIGDIEEGIRAARAAGAEDAGQAAVVQLGRVLSVEGKEGTDDMLHRAAEARLNGPGGVLVKVSKPGQETRADLPTIGEATVEAARAAGLSGIAVEAGATLVLDRAAVVKAADAAGLFVMGIDVPQGQAEER